MTCDQGRVVAFVHGQLSEAEEQAFDEHLLTCESCWQAVREDRIGRLALEQLRVGAPPGLADRVTASVGLAGRQAGGQGPVGSRRGRAAVRGRPLPSRRSAVGSRAEARRRAGRYVAGVVLVVVVAVGAIGWALHGRPAGDPPQIADVVAMMSPQVGSDAALRGGEQFDFGGQSLTVRSYRVEGIVTLVATSARPFPVPTSSDLLAGSSPTAWMATRGTLAMYGVNRPAGDGRTSMFLVAAMPVAKLPAVAARLHLI